MMKNIKHIALSLLAVGFLACENETLEDLRNRGQEEHHRQTVGHQHSGWICGNRFRWQPGWIYEDAAGAQM